MKATQGTPPVRMEGWHVVPMVQHPLAAQFRATAQVCGRKGPTNAKLLAEAADDLDAGGVTTAVMAGHERDRPGSVPGLRFAAAVHRLVLAGGVGRLARHYPSVGGRLDESRLWADAEPVMVAHVDDLRAAIRSGPVQTNEPGRSGPLFGGLLVAAQRAAAAAGRPEPFPVRLLEVGASAGLNLRPHRVRYRLPDGGVLGDPEGPFTLDAEWTGLPPAGIEHPLRVVERAACDPNPIDVSTPAGRLQLASFVWPDQIGRLRRLAGAMRLARADPVPIERSGGTDWLAAQLASPHREVLTVVWHSVVWQYVPASQRARGQQVMARAAARANEQTPLALLMYESRRVPGAPDKFRFELLLRLWPAGLSVCLGHGSGHGIPFEWAEQRV
jgi:hypothetical protein